MRPRVLSIFRAEAYLRKAWVCVMLQYTYIYMYRNSALQRANYGLNALADDNRHH